MFGLHLGQQVAEDIHLFPQFFLLLGEILIGSASVVSFMQLDRVEGNISTT